MLDLTFATTPELFSFVKTVKPEEKYKKYNYAMRIAKYYKRSAISDFAILLGGSYSEIKYASEKEDNRNRIGSFWLKTGREGEFCIVDNKGDITSENPFKHNIGIRPVVRYSSIKDSATNIKTKNSIFKKEVEFGEYPQMVASVTLSKKLAKLYLSNDENLKETGKSYTTNINIVKIDNPFFPYKHFEYEYNGEKYILFFSDETVNNKVLSNGVTAEDGNLYWIKVEPIVWLVDEVNDIAISKRVLLSGISIEDKFRYSGDFRNTQMKKFLDEYLSKEIICREVKEFEDNQENKKLNDIDSIFEEVITRMNEINNTSKIKIKVKK